MEPQRLQAGQGWQWIKQGYALFMKAPLLWIASIVIFPPATEVIADTTTETGTEA